MNTVAQTLIEHDEPQAPRLPAPVNPMDMIQRALEKNVAPEMLDKLLSLQERWEAGQARKAFDEAVAAAKAEIPVIAKNATGHNNKRYADFSAYARAIDPILGKFGLSYRFRTAQTDRIHVTCILSHRAGHSEENTLAGPPDSTGSKNAIQAIGSTLSYLSRYSLVQALGLAAGDDDDGKAAGTAEDAGELISEEQAGIIRALAEETATDMQKLCELWKVEAIPDLTTAQFPKAVAALETKKRRMAK